MVQSQAEDGTPMVEVAHEALLRSWARLTQWIEDTQDDLRLLRQVRLGAEEWDRGGRKDDDLLTDTRLERARGWLNSGSLNAGWRMPTLPPARTSASTSWQASTSGRRTNWHWSSGIGSACSLIVGILVVASIAGIILTTQLYQQIQAADNNAATSNANVMLAFAAQATANRGPKAEYRTA